MTARWRRRGWLGLFLIVVFWTLNWTLDGLRTHWGFFPLWLGYVLVVDALVEKRTGSSPYTRDRRTWMGMFVASAPVWWLFELFNVRLQNWQYLGREQFTDVEHALWSTLSFSTVIPAVLTTAEWVRSFEPVRSLPSGLPIRIGPSAWPWLQVFGWVTLAVVMLVPRVLFPLIWAAVYFIVEPINARAGRPNLFDPVGRGDWRLVLSLAIGCLICGFFWEMWNVLSYPKWIYHVPGVDFWRVFEMPILGYFGYLGFGLEIYALYHVVPWRSR